MRKIILLFIILLSFSRNSYAQESRVQMMMGKYFADVPLDSSLSCWNNTLASSQKFKFDTSCHFYHKIYTIAELNELKKYVPELHHVFITSFVLEFTMEGGKFVDTYEMLKVQYNLVDSLSKKTAKQVYKRLKESTNSLFRYTKEHFQFPDNPVVLRCSNRPFATFADLEISIAANKQTGSYTVGLVFARRKE